MMNYTSYREYLASAVFAVMRKAVMRRANGICEVCKTAKATEVHHIKYPPWGTHDLPSNMQAVCHACHCRIHEKDK